MLFSDYFEITKGKGDDWFDPMLDVDTKLFIDPLLVTDAPHINFRNIGGKISKFFDIAFQLAAESEAKRSDTKYIQLCSMMKFPEVQELCLGYSRSTKGAGAGD